MGKLGHNAYLGELALKIFSLAIRERGINLEKEANNNIAFASSSCSIQI